MTDGGTIRRGEPGDLGPVADLLVRAFVEGGFTPPERAAALRDVAPRAARMELFVAHDAAGRVVGAVFWGTPASGDLDVAGPGEGEIQLLAVDPAARGAGLGASLVDACLASARRAGVTRIVLSTQPTMSAAHRLYERAGFRRVPARDWQRHGVPRLVYALDLESGG